MRRTRWKSISKSDWFGVKRAIEGLKRQPWDWRSGKTGSERHWEGGRRQEVTEAKEGKHPGGVAGEGRGNSGSRHEQTTGEKR